MTRRWALVMYALSAVTLTACEDDNIRTLGPRGRDDFERYVSIGTSISQGFQSNGIVYTGQVNAWPALLARQARVGFDSPLIQAPGCNPPLIAPLAFSRLLSGGSAAQGDTTCAPNFPDVSLPENNVAIAGALTGEALSLTARAAAQGSDRNKRQRYSRVLLPDQTQVTAMMAQNPTFVSVELGANEVLGAVTSGVVIAGASYVPYAAWEPAYNQVVDSVAKTGAKAMLVTVPRVGAIVSLVPGSEIWAERFSFQQFGVLVQADCNGSTNLVFAPSKVLGLIGLARATGRPQPLFCSNNIPAPPSPDYVLTPADVTTLNAVVGQMNDHIVALATQHGWALLDANVALDQVVSETRARRPAFSLIKLLSCALPYGPYISLDGVHPGNIGHQLIANYAINAINARYSFALPTIVISRPVESGSCAESDPALAMR